MNYIVAIGISAAIVIISSCAGCAATVVPAPDDSTTCAPGWLYCDDPTPPSAPCGQDGNKCGCYTVTQCGLWHGGEF